VRPEIWAYGIRNPQGMAMNPWSDALWLNEHGPRGGDEINIPQAGKNYGWPLATHGINYSGLPIPEARQNGSGNRASPVCLAGLARGKRDGLLRGADLSPVAA
jgi:glucose/arabinose dehydrogenase